MVQLCAELAPPTFLFQFLAQQKMCSDLEATLAGNIEEHELLEGQFTAEHEEEVRALRQQKQHLIKKLEDVEEQYQTILDDQEQQVCTHYPIALLLQYYID